LPSAAVRENDARQREKQAGKDDVPGASSAAATGKTGKMKAMKNTEQKGELQAFLKKIQRDIGTFWQLRPGMHETLEQTAPPGQIKDDSRAEHPVRRLELSGDSLTLRGGIEERLLTHTGKHTSRLENRRRTVNHQIKKRNEKKRPRPRVTTDDTSFVRGQVKAKKK